MTAPTSRRSLQAFGRLAVALREKEPDVVLMRVYFRGLKRLESNSSRQPRNGLPNSGMVSEDMRVASRGGGGRKGNGRGAARAATKSRITALPGLLRYRLVLRRGGAGAPCVFRELRRLEVLGRRPMPELPPAHTDDGPLTPEDNAAAFAELNAADSRQ